MLSHLRTVPAVHQSATIRPCDLCKELLAPAPRPSRWTKPSCAVDEQKFTLLFRLPAELRLVVYRFALFPDTDSHCRQLKTLRTPPLLQVSRQLRAEALPVYCDNVRVNAFVTMVHSYEDVTLPSLHRGHRKLNKPASLLLTRAEPQQPDGPLPGVCFRHVTMALSDTDRCRLWTIGLTADKQRHAKLSLTKLPTDTILLGWLEILAIERLPYTWKDKLSAMLARPDFNGFTVHDIKCLVDMISIKYDKKEWQVDPYLNFGGDDITATMWDVCITDKSMDPVESFGNPNLGLESDDDAQDDDDNNDSDEEDEMDEDADEAEDAEVGGHANSDGPQSVSQHVQSGVAVAQKDGDGDVDMQMTA